MNRGTPDGRHLRDAIYRLALVQQGQHVSHFDGPGCRITAACECNMLIYCPEPHERSLPCETRVGFAPCRLPGSSPLYYCWPAALRKPVTIRTGRSASSFRRLQDLRRIFSPGCCSPILSARSGSLSSSTTAPA